MKFNSFVIFSFFLPSICCFLFKKSKETSDHRIPVLAKFDVEMPRPVRKILEKFGDEPIVEIQLGRTPVQKFLIFILNILSRKQFERRQIELGYDEIYHNYLLIRTENKIDKNHRFKLEKAQRVRLVDRIQSEELIELFDIPLNPNEKLTLNRFISKASNIDKQFYVYDAANNNMCQTFVENLVDINGLTKNIKQQKTIDALKPQDAKSLLQTLNKRKFIVKGLTDFAAKFDRLVRDEIFLLRPRQKLFYSYPQFRHFNQTDSRQTEQIYLLALKSNEQKPKNTNFIVFLAIFLLFSVFVVATVFTFRCWKRKSFGFFF